MTKIIIILVFILSLVLNISLYYGKRNDKQELVKYDYLAKRIFLENANDVIIDFVKLRRELKEYVNSKNEKIGLYFEYLPTGNSIGINEKEEFYRASLVKIPVVMKTLKLMSEGKVKGDEIIVIRPELIDKTYGNLWKRGGGAEITVDEAMRLIVEESDNTAYEVINAKINEDILNAELGVEQNLHDVYDFLDIPRKDNGLNQFVTPKNYTSILKSLYFSAYLPYDYSDKLLNMMNRSKYKEGLRSCIPDDIPISHKFGIYNLEPENLHVLSDCGIVYLPKRQYMLCVMVKSGDTGKASSYIKDISKMTYDYLSTKKCGE